MADVQTGPRRFAYYARLTAKQKATYRKSDEAPSFIIPDCVALIPLVAKLEEALATGKRPRVASATTELSSALLAQIFHAANVEIKPIKIHVRIVRPQLEDSELHGLYTFAHEGELPKLEVWMRTGAHEKVVRFRTFLRTLMHELAHHLDVTLLGLEDSFHTEGFFRRESSLVRQLAPRDHGDQAHKRSRHDAQQQQPLLLPSAPKAGPPTPKPRESKEDRQLSLFG